MELRHVRPGDARDGELSECGEDEAPKVAPVFGRRAGLEPDRDVFLVEPFRQSLDRDRFPASVPLSGWVFSIARGGDDRHGAVARVLAGQDCAGPEADPA